VALDPNALQTALGNYVANSTYETGGYAMAVAFVQSCRVLMLLLPKHGMQQGAQLGLNPELVKEAMVMAQVWIANNPDNGPKPGGVGYFGFNIGAR